MSPSPLRALLLVAVVCALAGCGPKLVREKIYDKPGARVELRHETSGGEVVKHGYQQPATIADVRIAHILASLSYEDDEEKRRPLIRSQFVYELAEGISVALAKAGPDDEVAAASFPEDRTLGIFTNEMVTAFRLYLVGDEMHIEFFSVEQPLDKDTSRMGVREFEIPTELPTYAPKFKIVPGKAQTRLGDRGVNVAWRDDFYRRPSSLSFREGQARRRTVLMDSPPEEEPEPGAPPKPLEPARPVGLSDLQMRALDQLDSARHNGLVKEADYQRRRRLILENRLDEAGYGNLP
jgi:hypothetical protein